MRSDRVHIAPVRVPQLSASRPPQPEAVTAELATCAPVATTNPASVEPPISSSRLARRLCQSTSATVTVSLTLTKPLPAAADGGNAAIDFCIGLVVRGAERRCARPAMDVARARHLRRGTCFAFATQAGRPERQRSGRPTRALPPLPAIGPPGVLRRGALVAVNVLARYPRPQ
jgi:hypothetical protein